MGVLDRFYLREISESASWRKEPEVASRQQWEMDVSIRSSPREMSLSGALNNSNRSARK
jgi:hypothetical protein